jgi:hypothetical protein
MDGYKTKGRIGLYGSAVSIFLLGVSLSLLIVLFQKVTVIDMFFDVDRSPPMHVFKSHEVDGLCEKLLDVHISYAEVNSLAMHAVGEGVIELRKAIAFLILVNSLSLLFGVISLHGNKGRLNG